MPYDHATYCIKDRKSCMGHTTVKHMEVTYSWIRVYDDLNSFHQTGDRVAGYEKSSTRYTNDCSVCCFIVEYAAVMRQFDNQPMHE